RRTGVNELAKVFVGEVVLLAEFAHVEGFLGVFVPEAEAVLAQVIFIVPEQFFQAGAGHVGELKFGLLGRAGNAAALGDVLVSAARGLHHRVVGAGLPVNEAVAKADGGVVDDLGLGVGEKFFVAAVRGD